MNSLDVDYGSVIKNSVVGKGTRIHKYCNIYDSKIGRNCSIASYVEIGGAEVGDNCKIEAYTFIPPGVVICSGVFVGPHVVFTNDKFPRARGEWTRVPTSIQDDVSIGANSTIMSGITVHKGAMIGAGSVVTKSVPMDAVWYGPAAEHRKTIH